MLLDGKPLDDLELYPELLENYEDLVEHLQLNYNQKETRESAARELQLHLSVKPKRINDLDDYAAKLEKLVDTIERGASKESIMRRKLDLLVDSIPNECKSKCVGIKHSNFREAITYMKTIWSYDLTAVLSAKGHNSILNRNPNNASKSNDKQKRPDNPNGKDTSNIKCHGCGKTGHIRPRCPENTTNNKTGNNIINTGKYQVEKVHKKIKQLKKQELIAIEILVNEVKVVALCDTGTNVVTIHPDLAKYLGLKNNRTAHISTIAGKKCEKMSNHPLIVKYKDRSTTISETMIAMQPCSFSLYQLIIGNQVMKNLGLEIDIINLSVTTKKKAIHTSMMIQEKDETFDKTEFINSIKQRFPNSYAKFKGDAGPEKVYVEKMEFEKKSPAPMKMYSIPKNLKEEHTKLVKEMLNQGIIEHSSSTKIHPTLLLKKPNSEEYRFLFDGRLYNQLMIKINSYPNDANKIFLEIKDFTHISKIDLSNAFHQFSIHKENREYFAFNSQLGTMQYKRLIMRGKNSTILFQLAMERTFKEIKKYIKIFVDDVIILTSGSFDFHRSILFKFFNICNNLEMKVSLAKCQFNAKYIKFLSYKVGPRGITPCDESVDKLIRRYVPTSKKELYNFLQSASYFRRCLPNFASKTADLFTLAAGKNSKIEFSKENMEAFESIKEDLIKAPKLAFYNPSFKTFLTTDASNNAVEAYLSQVDPSTNEERPIAFWSAKLPTTIKDRCPTYTELYAIEHALRYFGYLVANISLTIRSDHKSLGKIMTTSNKKYIELLHGIDSHFCHITYIPGCNNQVADLLSRLNDPKECNNINTSITSSLQAIKPSQLTESIAQLCNRMNIAEEQQRDVNIQHALNDGHINNFKIATHDQEIVKINFGGCEKIYLPLKLIHPILELAHDFNNHQGFKKMTKMLNSFYSPFFKKMIKDKVNSCDTCLKHNVIPTKHPIPKVIPFYEVMENLVMDFSGPHSEEGKYKEKYLLVIVDTSSKYL